MMSETESLETRVEHLEQLETKVEAVDAWVKTGFRAQGKELQGLETTVQILDRNLKRQQDTDRTQYNLDKATLNGILEQLRDIHAKMTVQSVECNLTTQQNTHRTDALAARVAALEKPWYRSVGATKASGHPEADKSTLLQRMETFNS